MNKVEESPLRRGLNWNIAPLTAAIALLIQTGAALAQPCQEWINVSPQLAPEARTEHAMAFDSARGVTVLFSGWDNPDYFPETWAWNGAQWNVVATDGPPPRHGHGMVFDSRRQVVVLFGGENFNPFGDTWEWDGQTWSFITNQGPSPRSWHSMAYDSARGVTVLFGGRSDAGTESDTWEWNGSQWTRVADTGPLRRYNHAMAYDASRGVVVLFGGRPSAFGDTWEWDGARWTRVATTGPRARYQHSLVYDDARRRVLAFGGYDDDRNYYGDTWQWDGLQWTQLSIALPPAPRLYHAMTFDTLRKAAVLFGGSDGRARRDDTWELRAPWWFEEHPQSATVFEGQSVTFQVATGGSGGLVYQWRRDGDDLANGGTISGADTDTLQISNARRADAGFYDCLVSDGRCGQASDPALLNVTAPTILIAATCPDGGPVSVSWEQATPNGLVALLFAAHEGRARIPNGQVCAGTWLGLSKSMLRLVATEVSDANGEGTLESIAPARACGGRLRLIDLYTCASSNIATIE